MTGTTHSWTQIHHVNLPCGSGDSVPQKLQSTSSGQPPSTIGHSNVRLSRKPVFQVFCDEDAPEAKTCTKASYLRTQERTMKSSATLQTVVNNKENRIPEFDDRTVPIVRPTTRFATRARVLGEKAPSASARVNCVDKWDSQIPFAPCEPIPKKSGKPFQPIQKTIQTRPPSCSQPQKDILRQPKLRLTVPERNSGTSRINSHDSRPATLRTTHTSQASPPHSLATGLDELVSKLEALQADGKEDEVAQLLEPLPPTAVCPGAPKMPTVFQMPVFISDYDIPLEDDHHDQMVELKSPSLHQMSPLAEVTEAYTGLQGGWSPPIETFNTLLDDPMSSDASDPLFKFQLRSPLASTTKKLVDLNELSAPLQLTKPEYDLNLLPEPVPVNASAASSDSSRVPAKGPLRI